MDIEYLKQAKKSKKMKLQDISDLSGIPKRTVDDIFSGHTVNPRADTLQAIERALGINNEKTAPEYTEAEMQLFELIKQLTDEETEELSNFVDFILSKRK